MMANARARLLPALTEARTAGERGDCGHAINLLASAIGELAELVDLASPSVPASVTPERELTHAERINRDFGTGIR